MIALPLPYCVRHSAFRPSLSNRRQRGLESRREYKWEGSATPPQSGPSPNRSPRAAAYTSRYEERHAVPILGRERPSGAAQMLPCRSALPATLCPSTTLKVEAAGIERASRTQCATAWNCSGLPRSVRKGRSSYRRANTNSNIQLAMRLTC
jgi:hypothetical protein